MSRRAQSTMEYMVLIGVMVAALIAMQVYLKRGLQGRIKSYAEQLTQGAAYSPRATNSTQIITRIVNETSSSATICRDRNGNEIDCNDNTIPIEERTKIRVSDSNVTIAQATNQQEDILPFADEPRRW
mgnify:CR=1 FL=1